MRLLCFSDLHRNISAAQHLVSIAEDADVVIGAGDFATRRKGLSDTLDILKQIKQPTVLVPGNGESYEELKMACQSWEQARVLHGNGCEILGVPFWGVGGGIPVTPFGDWSYDFDEEKAEKMLADCPTGAVLVTHSPPIDTVDHDQSGQIRGSKAIRTAVENQAPLAVICGHIHSDWGKSTLLGQTVIQNAGPGGVWIELTP
jgi:Icc-related predicted phosphoesterase